MSNIAQTRSLANIAQTRSLAAQERTQRSFAHSLYTKFALRHTLITLVNRDVLQHCAGIAAAAGAAKDSSE